MRRLQLSISSPLPLLVFALIYGRISAFVAPRKARSSRGLRLFSPCTSPRYVRERGNSGRLSESSTESTTERVSIQQDLLAQIAATPSNAPTSRTATQAILATIRELEQQCPMDETVGKGNDAFLKKLSGNWELLWTTQDEKSDEWNLAGPLRRWINPLENQAYSNNPLGEEEGRTGRANPILPRPIQDRLESLGVIDTNTDDVSTNSVNSVEPLVRSSQSIDIAKGLVRNVVTFRVPTLFPKRSTSKQQSATTITLTVLIAFTPDTVDARKINVKFESCRVRVRPSLSLVPSDVNIPLGIIGPSGWLRTTYLDDELRITRGFKGSVFVLQRP